MNRFGAFAVHLGISLVIFLILGYVILFHWYPDFFFTSDGGWQGIRIVALVDLVLGPVLTLVVYRKGKPSLRFDLTAIAVFQAVCLTGGSWVVYSERPIAMVFSDGVFYSMTRDDYLQTGQPVPDLSAFPGTPPRWVSVRLPEDLEAQAEIRRRALEARVPLRARAEFYAPFEIGHIDRHRDGIDPSELIQRDRMTPFLETFLAGRDRALEDHLFLPFGTRYQLSLIALDLETGALEFLAIPGGLHGPVSG